MSSHPDFHRSPGNGSTAGHAAAGDQYDRCRASASSTDALVSVAEQHIQAEIIAAKCATTAADYSVTLHAEAIRLLAESDFSNLSDPALRDIAGRDHLHVINAFLSRNPQTPLRVELEDTVVILRAESIYYRSQKNTRRDS